MTNNEERGTEPPARTKLIAANRGRRERVLDDHMFTLPHPKLSRVGTARAQVFTGAGLRPVVLTQSVRDAGTSLINGAEYYAEVCWTVLCPDQPQPPLFVSNLLQDHEDDEDDEGNEAAGDGEDRSPSDRDEPNPSPVHPQSATRRMMHLDLVSFTVADGHRLSRPSWCPLSPKNLFELVGGEVDLTRGSGFRPPRPRPASVAHHQVRWLLTLPQPDPFRERCMTRSTGISRRLVRQLLPTHATRDCCWYHAATGTPSPGRPSRSFGAANAQAC